MKKSGGQIWREGQAKLNSQVKAKFVEKEWGHEICMANNKAENY